MRGVVLWLSSLLVAATAVAGLCIGWEIWRIPDVTQRIGALGDVLGGIAGALALVAAVVAILAYAAATATPNLELEYNFKGNQGPGILRFQIDPDGTLAPGHVNLEQNPELIGLLKLTNKARVSARNPAVRLEFLGMGRQTIFNGNVLNLGTDWEQVRPAHPDANFAVQWDGGSNLSIHGSWARSLPEVNLHGLYGVAEAQSTSLRFSVVAEGFNKEWVQPIDLFVQNG